MYLKSSLLCFLALAPNANANWFSSFLRGSNKDSAVSSNEENPVARTTEGRVVEEAAPNEIPPEEIVPTMIHEAVAVMCEHNPVEVFRWTPPLLHHYLDPGSAAQWDNPKWRQHVRLIDCEGMRFGHPIRLEGQAILCLDIPDTVFRFNNDGVLHAYANPTVATKYDPNWRDDVMHLYCSEMDLQFGSDIEQ
uniref:Uncharacterized protein n=2 Tax=Chaetoceros debilis TaxID=122233 RepID=A0A7S3Q257_9STRA|eukprot:CAMPEP_0194074580 /NCGR_PEP_ID=MMETSP0149-20130528/1672_1 /TAXON_ID=122233 /ORGANISM="Chaetoceros debilis, Strain MM31A-1" /LENGTH=191 /DNA_ID=CAMNT_0038754797 /DNA_START=17 /DNA_END=592 /DNA_ORIENTATION=+